MKGHNKSITLLELLIGLVLLAVIVLGLTSIDFFSRHNVVNADIIARLQNKGFLGLEHMRKNLVSAIGNEYINGANQVVDIQDTSDPNEAARLKVFVDYNNDGDRDAAGTDYWRAYRVFYNLGNPADRFQLFYCQRCQNKNCNNCDPGVGGFAWVPIVSNVIQFIPVKPVVNPGVDETLRDNYIEAEITTCLHPDWNFNADAQDDCGTPNNPQVTMHTRIFMPAVSNN